MKNPPKCSRCGRNPLEVWDKKEWQVYGQGCFCEQCVKSLTEAEMKYYLEQHLAEERK